MTELYKKDVTGVIRYWGIFSIIDGFITTHGVLDGAMQNKTTAVRKGKVNRTVEEQIELEMNSRISKKFDDGYMESLDKVMKSRAVNTLGLPKPMLAQPIRKVKDIDYTNAYVQRKYDGNRCMIYCKNGVNKAYTRNGKEINTISHILKFIELEDGMIVDGELYCHGERLQTLVSWIKREQMDTKRLVYKLYDIVSDKPFIERLKIIEGLNIGYSIEPAESYPITSYVDLAVLFRTFREEGYEGAILRVGTSGYEDGKRSKSLIKVKEWEDNEFLVVGIIPSKDNWAILECVTEDGIDFTASAPGTMEDKTRVLRDKDDYINRYVTIEYSNLTEDGTPFHPVALRFREDI